MTDAHQSWHQTKPADRGLYASIYVVAYSFVSLLLISLLLVPTTASAEPIKPKLRMVPGDTMHYTVSTQQTLSTRRMGSQMFDYSIGMGLTVESELDDGSVEVRETIDSFELRGGEAGAVDPSSVVGLELTFVMHPDGTVTDLKVEGSDTAVFSYGGASGLTTTFPPNGLEVGQSYETSTTLPIAFTASPLTIPVRTTLDALVIEQDRPAARVLQDFKIKDQELSVGPFGAAAVARLSGDGTSTSYLSLDTGWTLRSDASVSITLTVQSGEQMESADVVQAMQFVMDDQNLIEE